MREIFTQNCPSARRRAVITAAVVAAGLAVQSATFAGTIWDGGGANTNINTAANWDADTLPDLTGGTGGVTFGTGGTTATLSADAFLLNMTVNRSAATGFTFASGAGSLILRSSNSGTTYNLTTSSAVGGTVTIDSALKVSTNNADANKLLVVRNNSTTKLLDINGAVGLSADSTTGFQLRYEGVAGAVTRFDGAISNCLTIQQTGGVWAGELLIGGNQSLGSTNINIATTGSGVGTPTSAARLTLGESASDVQAFNNLTLNNTMTVNVGGTVTVNAIAGTGTSKIVGSGAGTGVLKVSSGTIASNMGLGGATTLENSLSLVKQGTGTLNIDGAKSFTGGTTVNAGTLNLTGALASGITLNTGATLSGEGSTAGTLSFGTGTSSLSFDQSTAGAFTAGNVSFASGALVNISPAAATTIGSTYSVLKLSAGMFSGAPTTNFVAAARGTLAYASANSELTFTPTGAASLKWKGSAGTSWDIANTLNWDNASSPDRFYTNDAVTFDDTASSFTVNIAPSTITPGNVTFDNSANDYTVTGGGLIGAASVTKNGAGTVTFANGTNTFTGGLTVNSGKLVAGTGQLGTLSLAKPIGLNGGTLSYTGATLASDNLALAVGGDATLEVTTPGNTVRVGGPLTGAGNLTIAGAGIVAMGKNAVATLGNTFTGNLTVANGATLDIRNPDSMGATGPASKAIVQTGGRLLINPFNQPAGVTFNAEQTDFQDGATLAYWNQATTGSTTNTLTGPVTLTGNTTVQSLSNGGAAGLVISGNISGTGGFTKTGSGSLALTGSNTYGGATVIQAGNVRATSSAYAPMLTSGSGGLDLQGGQFVFDYTGDVSPVASVKAYLDAAAVGNFASGQIRSTALAANRTIGYGDNGAGNVTLILTLPGDADLNGQVNFNDFLILQNSFGNTGTRFDQGNFNFDGTTDFNDFLVLQNNFGSSVTGAAVQITAAQASAVAAFASAVPEPASIGLLGIGGMMLGRRRRAC